MIATLEGRLVYKSPDEAVIDVNGVGYQLFLSLETFSRLPEPGEKVVLQTYTHVREDALQLYGFFSQQEKKLFQLLIGVAKIGPRLARNILSGLSVEELKQAISTADVVTISAIPGVGRKTAERMVVELQDKIGALPVSGQSISRPGFSSQSTQEVDAISALVNLGYKQAAAQRAVKKILAEKEAAALSLQELVKDALRRLGMA